MRLTDSPAVDDTKAGNEESDREKKGMRDRVSRLVAKKRYSISSDVFFLSNPVLVVVVVILS